MGGTELDIQICARAGDEWVLSTDPMITLSMSACRGTAAWGELPVVSAAIILYYKAIPPRWRAKPPAPRRAKDDADFAALTPTLSTAQRGWLRQAIESCRPDHDWLRTL